MAEVEKDDLLADVRAAAEGLENPEPVETERQAPVETEQEKADRVRDEQGRFAKAEEKPRETLKLKPKETPAESSTPDSETGKPAQAPAAASPAASAAATTPETVAPPAEWKGAGKVQWNKLPKAIQAELRETYDSVAQSREQFAPIEAAIAPHRDAWIRDAGSVDRAISQLGQFYQLYVENPIGLIQHIARTRGIDLGAPQGQPPAQGGTPQSAPDISNLIAQHVQQAIAPIQQRFQQTENQQIEQTLEEFRADPRHPYFEDVRVTMGQLIQAGIAKGLPDAYEQAVKLNPAIWSALELQRAEEAKNSSAAEAERARKAANASLRGSPLPNGHAGGGAGSNASVLDDVRAAAAELSGS